MRILLYILIIPLMISAACSKSEKNDNVKIKSKTDEKIEFYRHKTEADPGAYAYHNRLAQVYIQKARETGNTDYYQSARSALSDSLKSNPKNYIGIVYMAMLNIAEHNFKQALEYAILATELKPNNSYAYGVLGDAYLDLGEIEKAENAYIKMVELKPGLDSYSRLSNLRVVKGDTGGAIESMEKAYESGLKDARTSKENLAWTRVMVGAIYLNSGELDQAERYFQSSLEIMPDYYLALEHLAEVNAIRGNYEEAASLYKWVLNLNPAPEFYLALAGVYEDQGKLDEAKELRSIALGIYEEKVQNGNVGYLRALALYYANNDINLNEALRLAKRDLEIRNDYGAYDTLAWVYYKLGDYENALQSAKQSLKYGTKDSNLYYHIGIINEKLGNHEDAKKYLTLAISNNPYFDKSGANESKRILSQLNIAS